MNDETQAKIEEIDVLREIHSQRELEHQTLENMATKSLVRNNYASISCLRDDEPTLPDNITNVLHVAFGIAAEMMKEHVKVVSAKLDEEVLMEDAIYTACEEACQNDRDSR